MAILRNQIDHQLKLVILKNFAATKYFAIYSSFIDKFMHFSKKKS